MRAIAALHGRSDRVEVVLDRARLTELAGRRVEACSGGEQQRLKFALALLPDPDLVVLDEPTTGMDVGARQEFWRAMREDAALGRTIVFATHYLAEADEFAERTVLMNRGRIVHDAATTDVRAAYGGRTLTFRPPAEVVGTDGIDDDWLARVRAASSRWASPTSTSPPRASRPRSSPSPQTTSRSEPHDDRDHRHQPGPPASRAACAPPPDRRCSPTRASTCVVSCATGSACSSSSALPTFMYLVFGLGSDDPVGSGNVGMYVMISMAAYGAVTATTSVAGSAATEQVMGWGRQLGLTPMRPLAFVAAKPAVAMSVAAVPVSRSSPSGRRPARAATASDWVRRAASCGSGRRCSRSTAWRSAWSSAATTRPASRPGMIVVLAFLGNVFTPMSGFMLDLGRFTPALRLRRAGPLPAHRRVPPVGGRDALWLPVANVLAWTVIFALVALWGVRRSRART